MSEAEQPQTVQPYLPDDLERLMQSEDISDHHEALARLGLIAVDLSRGKQLDTDPRGMIMTQHHIYGGPENAPKIVECKTRRTFYSMSANIMRVRRDIHSYIEQQWGWFKLPTIEVIGQVLTDSDHHLSRSARKHRRVCTHE